YFRWAAADDLSAPQSLARCVEVLDREPAVVLAYPKTRFIDEHGRVILDYDDRLHLQSPRPRERFRQVLERLGRCNAAYGLMRAVVRAPLGVPEKLLLHLFLVRNAVSNRDRLVRELVGATRELLAGVSR